MHISDWSSDVCSSDLTERRFAGVMAIVFSADDLALLVRRGVMETVKFMPDERRDPRDVECILARDAGIAQLLGKATTLEQLHAARVGQTHLGMAGRDRTSTRLNSSH